MLLAPGVNYLWVACTISANADIDHVVGAFCHELVFSDGTRRTLSLTEGKGMLSIRL